MKKFIATLMMMAMLAVALPLAANAQTNGRRYARSRTNTSSVYKRPNFYQRHRKLQQQSQLCDARLCCRTASELLPAAS